MTEHLYPWYTAVSGTELQQGDILEDCPVIQLPENMQIADLDGASLDLDFSERNVIVVSQTCDMVSGREKLDFVLLCTLWTPLELSKPPFDKPAGFEDVRKGKWPGLHLIAACNTPGFERQVRVVDFRRTYTLPLGFVRQMALDAGDRLRLLPPYREHLSQAFARFFMRVGLPVDIPPFK